jgi:CRISPR-associated protein Cmr3
VWIFLEPLDALLFRDARPFAAGESFRAKSLFPPNPYSVVGAVRAKILADQGVPFAEFRRWAQDPPPEEKWKEIRESIGTPRDYGRLSIRGPLVAREEGDRSYTCYYPAPLNLFQKGVLNPLENPPDGMKWNQPGALRPLWSVDAVGEELAGAFLSEKELNRFLLDAAVDGVSRPEDPYIRETRIGIKLGSRRTAEAGMFYMAEFIRFREEGYGFLVEVNGIPENLLKSGPLALGGEGRAAVVRRVPGSVADPVRKDGESLEELGRKIGESGRFKIYLAQPAVFSCGWLPDFLDARTMEVKGGHRLRSDGLAFRLVAASVGRPAAVGGWDLALGRPKEMWRAVPAGSVYFFEFIGNRPLEREVVDLLIDTFHFTTKFQEFADGERLSVLSRIGFGLTLVGTWSPTKPL